MCYTFQSFFYWLFNYMISLWRFQCHMGLRFALVSLVSGALIFCLSVLFLSFRYIAMMFFKKLSLLDIASFCVAFFPRLILLSVSVGFIVGLSWYYTIIFRRNYYVSMSSFGISPSFFLRPTLGVIFFVSFLFWGLSSSFFPSLVRLGKSAERAASNRVDVSFFVPRVLFHRGESFFYAHGKQENNQFKGIFFVDQKERGKEKIFLSRKAFMQSKEGGVFALLRDGQGIFLDHQSGPSLLSFSEYRSFFADSNVGSTNKKKPFIQGIQSSDLWGGDIEQRQELCRRITLPFFSLIPGCFFYSIVWTLGIQFLWLSVLGSVVFCGVVWATAHQIYVFTAILLILAFVITFFVGELRQ